jgi:hypothetical protein
MVETVQQLGTVLMGPAVLAERERDGIQGSREDRSGQKKCEGFAKQELKQG